MCGVGAYSGKFEVAFQAVADVLFSLQHRGQESCGIAFVENGKIGVVKGMGLVRDVLALNDSRSSVAIGHVRYPTAGKPDLPNAQPQVYEVDGETVLALASNGDVVNYWELREELEGEGVNFLSENDGELLVKFLGTLIFKRGKSREEAFGELLKRVKGAFSGLALFSDSIWVFRDPFGFRPLSVARTEEGDLVVASETCGFGIVGGREWQDLPAGSVWEVRGRELNEVLRESAEPRHCVFELIYFARPDSVVFGVDVYDFRKRAGKLLAQKESRDVDVVVPVPDSSNAVALGYSQHIGVPFEFGLIRNHYVGRTFIRPHQTFRDESVKRKFNPVRGAIEGKSVVLIDDSIVRGTTLRKLILRHSASLSDKSRLEKTGRTQIPLDNG